MPSQKFKFNIGTLHVKTIERPAEDEAFGIRYRTKKNGLTMRCRGFYATEAQRDEKYEAFNKAAALDMLRGMQTFMGKAKKPQSKIKQK